MSGWEPQRYDPAAHHRRMSAAQQPNTGQQQYPPPGYGQPQYQQQGYPPPRHQPPRRKPWVRRHKVATTFFAIICISGVGVVLSSGGSDAGAPSTGGAPPVVGAKVKPHLVATFTGSGVENTGRFMVRSTWKLAYGFNCAHFGDQGNFVVLEDNGSDFNGVTVNDLAAKKTGTSWAYNDAGTHYLAIDSKCRWSVKIYDES